MAGNVKKLLLIICVAATFFCFALGANEPSSNVTTPPDDTALIPTIEPTAAPTPFKTPEALPPETTPSNGSEHNTSGGFQPGDLVGIAYPEDKLPSIASYEEAKAINPDVIGWIQIPGTNIDYPVVRGEDNNFYLENNVEREKSRYGAIFMDHRNANPDQQRHIIIYGHNMKNGTMFHSLMNYKQRDFFNKHRLINLLWDGVNTVWEIYLAYIVKPEIYHIHTRFGSDENFAEVMMDTLAYAKTVKPANMVDNMRILPSDQVLTLSTCTYEYDDTFFAVMARRIN